MNRLTVLFLLSFLMFGSDLKSAETPADLERFISKTMPGFRLIAAKDYVDALSEKDRGEPKFGEDFNADGRKDWAALVINDRTKEYRAYYFLASKSGYKPDLLFTRKWKGQGDGGVVRTPMFLKRAGDPGISERTYNSLTQDGDPPESISPEELKRQHDHKARPYKAVPAVEIWTGQNGDEQDIDLELIAYCSQTLQRYYGFLANRNRAEKLHRVRLLLSDPDGSTPKPPSTSEAPPPGGQPADQPDLCPQCKQGRLVVIARIGTPFHRARKPWSFDSS